MTVVVTDDGAPSPVTEQAVPAEMAGAAVAVAEIQADRDVAIAEIQAETTVAVIEAGTDDEDVQWLRDELATLQARCATLEGASSSQEAAIVALSAQVGEMASGLAILIASTQPPSLPPTPLETVTETPPAEAPEAVLDDAGAGPRASGGAEPPGKAAVRQARLRWL